MIHRTVSLFSMGLVLATTIVDLAFGQGTNPSEAYRSDRVRESLDVPLGDYYTGRSPYSSPMVKRAPAPRKVTPMPVAKELCAETRFGIINMFKTMPAEATLGQEFVSTINLLAIDCAANVVVTDLVPDGLEYVRSEPAAEQTGRNLTWRFASMDADQSKTIKVWFRPTRQGTFKNCASVSADPRVCATVFVGKAELSIFKKGPQTAQLNSDVTYTITVVNNGSSIARSVVVTDTVPAGFSHSSGQSTLSFPVGDLAPKQSKDINVTLKANQRGQFCNKAAAKASNTSEVKAEACTLVQQPGLAIAKTGTKTQFINRQASYNIVVSNTGDTTLTDVVVTDNAPSPTRIVSAPGASISGNTATWQIPSLAKGDKRTLTINLTSPKAGNYCNQVSAQTAQRLTASSQACTDWQGLSALLLEKGDNPDPIQVGETTTYFVRVTNQGTANDTNVKVVVQFHDELTPVSADNGGVIQGKTVTFPAYPRLAPKQAFEYHITAKGVKAGDSRVTFIRTSDDIPAPTSAEESTRVY